jgi:Flp pilus assembly protein TadD
VALAIPLLLAVLGVAGCGRSGSTPGATATPAAGADTPQRQRSQTFIEAGNEAYRSGDFELALKRYAAAAVADPRDPAAYFGMGMTFTRLHREDEARAAFARAQELSRRGSAPGPPAR